MTTDQAAPTPFTQTPSTPRTVVPTEAPRILPTLNNDGSRRWIKPRPSSGRFLTARRWVAYGLILIFTLIPYLKMGGKPLILLDLTKRRFTFFGTTFLPTDTLLMALLVVGCFLSIFFITALFGRLWCGWACPQTVYMEFVFRPIERFFDGTPGRGKKNWLASSGMGKALKPIVYLLVSMYLAHTFLAYFVGVEQLRVWVTLSPSDHMTPFLVMAFVTAAMMFDFLYFREQTCLVACPYGRFQSALIDRQSMIIGYDRARGEPRGKSGRKTAPVSGDVALPVLSGNGETARTGDCVDCSMCVTTCPTGIDIRNGLQMECIGCAQCIDACDAVMVKLNRPKGLIRYSSQAMLAGEKPHRLRPRVIIYPTLVTIIFSAFVVLLSTLAPAKVTLLRGVGVPFFEQPDGSVVNNIRVKIVNRSDEPREYHVSIASAAEGFLTQGARVEAEENPVRVAPGQVRTIPARVITPAGAFAAHANGRVHVSDNKGFSKDVKVLLIGPSHPTHPDRHAKDVDEDHDKDHDRQRADPDDADKEEAKP